MASAAEAMRSLQMVAHGDGVSRFNTLVQDVLTVLDQENMEGFDEQEPQAYIAFLIAALRPSVLKVTIQAEPKTTSKRPVQGKFTGVRGLDQAPSVIV
uniref:AlNc14C169G7961 protein n=1 Tax=Albugo laibachii Nc14 TaxID=890382 RepID=F0WND1_9STRA|nr:AlNc14C169G7961 [Albugo laibachii Nc14]|eukprot:CCA22822.1 AlNc14C169G7961 [Albugo laibachii Nc14]